MIKDTNFIVVDLETTGLEPRLDKIIEIGAVKIRNSQLVGEWSRLLNPGVFLPDITTNITGITNEMLQGAPVFEDIMDDFLNFIGEDSVFVAHNVEFDRGFLNAKLVENGRLAIANPYLCTYRLAKHVHPNLPKYKLGALAEYFDVPLEKAHRASHDARATSELLVKFMNVLQAGGLHDLRDLHLMENMKKPNVFTEQLDVQATLF